MATAHSFSVFANSLVHRPLNPTTGLIAARDERLPTNHRSTVADASAPRGDEEDPGGGSGGRLVDAVRRSQENSSEIFYDELREMKEQNNRSLEAFERLYHQKVTQKETGSHSTKTDGVLWNVENIISTNDSRKTEQKSNKNTELKQKTNLVVMKGGRRVTATGKPPSGKPNMSDGLPTKSGVAAKAQHSRSWAERITSTEPIWKAPLSRASSDFDLSDVQRFKDLVMSLNQIEITKPADDIWESYSFMDYEEKPHTKSTVAIKRSSSMSRLPTSKSDVLDRSSVDFWKNKVTVPEPFSMTLRDENKAPRKTKAAIELEQKRVEKELKEELECQKTFKATPPPAHIYMPLFQEIVEEQETRRRTIHQHSQELLESIQQPFQFTLREEEKESQRRTLSAPVNGRTSNAAFKAKPFPSRIFDDSFVSKMADEEEYRHIRAKLRAKQLMKSAKLPFSAEGRDEDYVVGKSRQKEKALKAAKSTLSVKSSFHPKVHKKVPDLDEKYLKFLASVQKIQQRPTTVCKPFELHTSKQALKKKILAEENASWNSVTENGYSLKSHKFRSLSRSLVGLLSVSLDSIPAKTTKAAQLRASQTKLKQQKMTEKEAAEMRDKHCKLLKEKELKRVVITRSAAADAHLHSVDLKDLLKAKMAADRERSAEYRRQLKEMTKRLHNRPLLFEQTAEKNARMAAERKYYAALSKSGISADYLSKKSSSDVIEPTSINDDDAVNIEDHSSPSPEKIEESLMMSDRKSERESKASSRVSSRASSRVSSRASSRRTSQQISVKSEDEEEEEEEEVKEVIEENGKEDYSQDFMDGSENNSDSNESVDENSLPTEIP